MQRRINENHMRNGVTLVNPENTYIDIDVKIGQDTVIEPGVMLRGKTVIGDDCVVTSGSEIVSSVIGERVHVRNSSIFESKVGDDVQIGPYAHLRPESDIHNHVKIGNYVETKKQLSVKELNYLISFTWEMRKLVKTSMLVAEVLLLITMAKIKQKPSLVIMSLLDVTQT